MNKILRAVIVTLVILAITGITGAAVYALGQNTAVTSAIIGNAGFGEGRGPAFGEGTGQGRGRIEGQRPAPPAGAQPGSLPPRDFEGEGGGGPNLSFFTLMGLARNLGLIAVITFAIVVFQKLIKLIFRRNPKQIAS